MADAWEEGVEVWHFGDGLALLEWVYEGWRGCVWSSVL
jgi:hypothetical protein